MPTVLVVDDEPSMRRALRGFLERAGINVMESSSGHEALDVLATGVAVDALVCDVLMPEFSGVDFFDALTAENPGMADRVVFLTGAAHDPQVNMRIEHRGVPLISKLDDMALVVDAVRLAIFRPRTI